MPSSLAAARIAAPVSGGRCSNVRQEPSDMADTAMPDEPSGRGRRLSAGIVQPPFDVPPEGAAACRLPVQVLIREPGRRAGQPAFGDRLAQRGRGRLPQLDEYGSVAVEVRDREEGARVGGEHGLLLAEIPDTDRQDRPVWRGLVAEPPDVRLAERPFPGERLAPDGPAPVAAALALGDLGQPRGHAGRVVQSRHTRTVTPQAAVGSPGPTGSPPATRTRGAPPPAGRRLDCVIVVAAVAFRSGWAMVLSRCAGRAWLGVACYTCAAASATGAGVCARLVRRPGR